MDKFKKQIPRITILVVILLIIAITVSIVVVTSIRAYYKQMQIDGEVLSGNYSSQYSIGVNSYLSKKSDELAEFASGIESEAELEERLRNEESKRDDASQIDQDIFFASLYYVKGGLVFDKFGFKSTLSSFANQQIANETDNFVYVGTDDNVKCVVIAKRIANSAICDYLVGFMRLEEFVQDFKAQSSFFKSLPNFYTMALCNEECDALTFFKNTDGDLVINNDEVTFNNSELKNFSTLLKNYDVYLTNDTIFNSIKQKNFYAKSVSQYQSGYVVTIVSPEISQNQLLIAHIYNVNDVIGVQNNFLGIIIMAVSVLALIVLVLVILGVRYRKAWINKMEYAENFEPLTGCNTYKMFKSEFERLKAKNKLSKYAVVYISLSQFDILYENYGETVTNDVIAFCGKVIQKSIDRNETYGHISNGKFIVLIHYNDLVDFDNRLGIIYALIHNYNKFQNVEHTLNFTAGVYLVKVSEKIDPDLFLSNAIVAEHSANILRTKYYCLYDEQIDKTRQNEREIELRKEQAIANKEFHVYYQPKLNLASDGVDGAEALVRWYYPETDTIYSPGKFMPIFELNGFVEKLDKYVYLEVLQFIRSMVDNGKKICPISVNVSRFTALQPDFLSFYIENKRKYKIADGFICVEFTESFAFDNNDKLRDIVFKLRENGIKCSIDDFGVGYSSYSILKDLPMDEIKLDAMFMKSGYDAERDKKTLCSVIKLGKDLGMKVTQEGVERSIEKEKLKEYGCDVIQGYCYSKPLSQDLFEKFLLERLGTVGKQQKSPNDGNNN